MASVSILTTSHSTFDTRIFHKQARTLAEGGHDVSLITPHKSDMKRDGIDIISVGGEDVDSADIGHAYKIYSIANNRNDDIIHIHDPGLLPFALKMSLLNDKKIIYDCHEDYGRAFRYYDSIPAKPITRRLYPPLQSLIAKQFDAVVAATDWIAEDFRNRGHNEVTLLRNFPRASMADRVDSNINREHEYTLVYVGGLSEERGLYDMLNLVADLSEHGLDVGLWLIGTLTDTTRTDIRDYSVERGITGRIRTFGYVESENIFQYLSAADIGLCLLRGGRAEYIIPTKMFEYMLSEIPVVATETVATSKYLPDECGVLVPEKREARTQAVKNLLLDQEVRNRMGTEGRKAVENEYSWEVEQEKLLSLYQRLL